jgi:hypothetical protein
LWTPEGAAGARPLVLYGHGGSQHKRVSNILRSARDLVVTEHYAVAAIDAPRHGDRAEVETERGAVNHSAEWLATVDALQRLDYVGEGPIGYWGVSMGTSFGVPYVAADERIDVAIFGLFGLFSGESEGPTAFEQAARSIDIPLMFVFQWNDQLMTPQQGLDLYEAFGSEDKVMHINPGGHTGIPVAERESWKPFFVRHLGKAHVRQK